MLLQDVSSSDHHTSRLQGEEEEDEGLKETKSTESFLEALELLYEFPQFWTTLCVYLRA